MEDGGGVRLKARDEGKCRVTHDVLVFLAKRDGRLEGERKIFQMRARQAG